MKIKPLEASLFKPLDDDLKMQLLLSGVVPVNDVFYPEWNNDAEIIIFYGGFGSGKSIFFADKFIHHAIEDKYFRGYFGRKILEDVRGTVFKTITDRIKELHKTHLFSFSDAPNGTMVITNRGNGNEMFPFGCSDAESLKSVKDPTHFFCEELDQFQYEDFKYIYSRLRTEKAITQFFGAFNTEKIYQSHWIRKILFDGEFSNQVHRLLANYSDNFFIDQESYYRKLQLIAGGDAMVLNAIAQGAWGAVRTGAEYWKQFSELKHVHKVKYSSGVIYCSLDENVVPYVTNLIWQIDLHSKKIKQIHEILSKSPDNNAPRAAHRFADHLDSIGHGDMVFVCGDPSASKRSTVDENSSSFYVKFIEVLNARGYRTQNKVMRSAPEVALSGAFVNDIYAGTLDGWNIEISDSCFQSIEEYITVKENAEGGVMKKMFTDPETKQTYQKQGHISDSKRYLILTVLAKEFESYKGFKSNIKNKIGYFR